MRRVPALVVGGGPAGAATAITLARRGVAAELIERTAGPHDLVCGGFLGWDALAALERLGIDVARHGARPIHRLRLVSGERAVEAALPRPAAGLSRRRLDEALLLRADQLGAQVRRGAKARQLDADTMSVLLDGDERIAAGALFLATGKHDLRGAARSVPARRGAGAVGLRTAVPLSGALDRALGGTIELHLFDGGYAGLLIQEDGRVNLCMSVAAARLRSAGGVQALLGEVAAGQPRLGDRLALAGREEWISVGNVPYGWRAAPGPPRLYRVGDQASVIASLAGDGVALALASGVAAAEAFLAGRSGVEHQRRWSARAARPLRIAEGLRRAAEHPRARPLLMGLARVPGLAGLAARLTRIA